MKRFLCLFIIMTLGFLTLFGCRSFNGHPTIYVKDNIKAIGGRYYQSDDADFYTIAIGSLDKPCLPFNAFKNPFAIKFNVIRLSVTC